MAKVEECLLKRDKLLIMGAVKVKGVLEGESYRAMPGREEGVIMTFLV